MIHQQQRIPLSVFMQSHSYPYSQINQILVHMSKYINNEGHFICFGLLGSYKRTNFFHLAYSCLDHLSLQK